MGDVSEFLGDLPDLVGGERSLLLSSGGGWRVELCGPVSSSACALLIRRVTRAVGAGFESSDVRLCQEAAASDRNVREHLWKM